jgi:hypothetical protein
VCNVSTGQCVECLSTGMNTCPLGQVCRSNRCVTPDSGVCDSSSDCGPGETCEGGRCVDTSNTNDFDRELILYGAIALGIIVFIAILIVIFVYF